METIPPELRDAMEQGVEIPGMGRVKHGGADPNRRGILKIDGLTPSVMQHNAYTNHLKENQIGFVTFLGSTSKSGNGEDITETVHQFQSANGETRLLLRFISSPVYFKDDWDYFMGESAKRNPTFLVSDKPLDQARLERRAELMHKSITFPELVNMARELKISSPQTLTREKLVEAMLDAEFIEANSD